MQQADRFSESILTAIGSYPPHFEDDFSSAGKGWEFGHEPQEGSGVVDGVIRAVATDGAAEFHNANLWRKDWLLQFDARIAEGDDSTTLVTIYRLVGEHKHFDLELSTSGTWLVRKLWGAGQPTEIFRQRDDAYRRGRWTRVLIVVRGARAAVHLNGTPVAYFEDADFDTFGDPEFQCQTSGRAVCEVDNVLFWDLRHVPGLQ